MKRLTEKGKRVPYRAKNECPINSYSACAQKLGQYEDIDEGLGINYIILVKALACGFYYKNPNHDNRIEYLSVPEVHPIITFDGTDKNYWVVSIHTLKEYHTVLRFCDYGHTWALTMEELK